MTLKFAAISRGKEFSPSHEINDWQIIKRTADCLIQLGADVTMYKESDFFERPIPEEFIFSMVQGTKGSQKLKEIEPHKKMVINSADSVIACYRKNMISILPASGIPFPRSLAMPSQALMDGELKNFDSDIVWIKRNDVHAVQKSDVIPVSRNNDDVSAELLRFSDRGIGNVILQENVKGDVVKFYAVRQRTFFHWYYLEAVNQTPFDTGKLYEIADASAALLGLYIYGGDAVISEDGAITIIDINDWPSFAPVREEAAREISLLIYQKALQHVNH